MNFYVIVVEFGVSHLRVPFFLSCSCFRLTESQRRNIHWTKDFFSDLFFSSLIFFCKNKSVFFLRFVRLFIWSGMKKIHLRIASHEKKENINFGERMRAEKKCTCRNSRIVPVYKPHKYSFCEQGYFYVSFRFDNCICIW